MHGKKIVIIEDEHDLAIALQENLTDKGFVVRVAETGEDALKLIQDDRPDVLLVDLLLPGMSGIELLEALKPLREEHNIPVIVLSNSDSREDLRDAKQYNIEEYLVKTDWKLADVIAKIKSVI